MTILFVPIFLISTDFFNGSTVLMAISPPETPNPVVEALPVASLATSTQTRAPNSVLPPHLTSCIAHGRLISPYQPPRVAEAKDIPAIRLEPRELGWVLFKPGKTYSKFGHAAIILKIDWQKRTMLISESNFIKNKEGRRVIQIDDPLIRGYFYTDF